MKHVANSRCGRKSLARYTYRPRLEDLETRQPVSDTVLGGLMTLSLMDPGLAVVDGNALKTDTGSQDLARAEQRRAQSMVNHGRSLFGLLEESHRAQTGNPLSQGDADERNNVSIPSLAGTDMAGAGGGALRAPASIGKGFEATMLRSTPNVVGTDPAAGKESSGGIVQVMSSLLRDVGLGQANIAGPPLLLGAPATTSAVVSSSAPQVLPTPVAEQHVAGVSALRFEANRGQFDSRIQFLARGPGYTVSLSPEEAVIRPRRSSVSGTGADGNQQVAVAQSAVHMQLVGANADPQMVGLHQLPGMVNYLIGSDASLWHTGVPSYSQVLYRNVYAGVDQIYYSNQGQLEYDFVLAPGADPSAIRLGFSGADRLEITSQGDLVVHASEAEVVFHKPVLYQPAGSHTGGRGAPVEGNFVLQGAKEVGFAVGVYDPHKTLVIDPSINYSTVFGQSQDDEGFGIAVDQTGASYVTGFTTSFAGNRQVFVAKLDNTGAIVYLTFVGGGRKDQGLRIAVDDQGQAVLTGFSQSPDYPTTPNALQPTLEGPRNAIVTQLDASGSELLYSSFLGGPGGEEGRGIALATNTAGQTFVYVTGITASASGFPIVNAAQPRYGGGNSDAFVTKMSLDQPAYIYSTYLGGSGDEDVTFQHESGGISVDRSGIAYVTGATTSDNFPVRNPFQQILRGAQDAFVTAFDPAGNLLYSTYLGGEAGESEGNGIGVTDVQNVYLAGATSSPRFPTSANAFQPQLRGSQNAFVTRLMPFVPPSRQLIYSTYLGGSSVDLAYDISVTPRGAAYVAGSTTSTDFPPVNPVEDYPGGDLNSFVAKFNSSSSISYSSYVGVPPSADRAVAWGYAAPQADRRANDSSPPEFCGGGPTGLPRRAGAPLGAARYGGGPGPEGSTSCTDANTAGSVGGITSTQVNVTQIADCPCALTITAGSRMGSSVQISWVDYCSDYTSSVTIQWTTSGGGSGSMTIDCGTGGCPSSTTMDNVPPGATFTIVAANSCCTTVESNPYYVP
jgi:hypothetical protein